MRKKNLFIFGMVFSVLSFFILDRFFKIFFLFQPTKSFKFLFFQFSLYKNEKIFFGLLPFNVFTIIFSFGLLFYLIYYLFFLWRKKEIFYFFAAALIFSGAVSNLIDRFHYGFVIDYLSWPLNFFNLADLVILAGAIILGIKLLAREKI